MFEPTENLISVIVINLNNGDGLKKTLSSIDRQCFKKYEVIYIDGGSQDNSLHVIEAYSELITKKIIGKDSGIYNAMNIGIANSNSRYLLFLNSGDYLYDENVFQVVNQNTKDLGNDFFVFGYAEIISKNLKWLFPSKKRASEPLSLKQWLLHAEPSHQAIFFPQDFCRANLFDENLTIIADKKFKRLAIDNLDFIFTETLIAIFPLGGVSNKISNAKILRNFIRDYYYYYIDEHVTLVGLYRMLIANLKVILKYGSQKILGDHFWFLLKTFKGYS